MTPAQRIVDWSLYGILDQESAGGRPLLSLANAMIAGGVSVIQLRDKRSSPRQFYQAALELRKITKERGIPLIINDRVDIAITVEADGVHLGQEDLPLADARACLGKDALIGASVHNDEEFAGALEYADYLGVGTIFPTSTKPDLPSKGPELVKSLRPRTDLPLIGIGGITASNVSDVVSAGADGVAVASGLLTTSDVRSQAEALLCKIASARLALEYELEEAH